MFSWRANVSFVLYRKSLDPRCPKDGQPLRMNFKDRHCEREVASLRVKCQRNNQCDWIGELKHLKVRRRNCTLNSAIILVLVTLT